MSAKTKKAKATEKKLFDAAVKLFSAKGFDGTTMRAIADEAGVATGAAYYYFASKDEVVQRLYQETLEGDSDIVQTLLDEPEATKRVNRYVAWKLERLAPYHAAVGAMVGRILTPRTGLSPFGDEQSALRQRDLQNLSRLVAGTSPAGDEASEHRTRALWALWMTVLFLWLHDDRDDRNVRALERFGTAAKTLLQLPDTMVIMGATMLGPLWSDMTAGKAPQAPR